MGGILGLLAGYGAVLLCLVIIVTVGNIYQNMWVAGIVGSLASVVVWAITMWLIFSIARKKEKSLS